MVAIRDEQLRELRRQINQVDNQILSLVEARFELAKQVADRKKEAGLPIRDLEREEEVISSKCEKTELNEDFVRKFFRMMIDEVVRMEEAR